MTLPPSVAILTLSLGTLLLAGGGAGYWLGRRCVPPAAVVSEGTIGTLTGASPRQWADQALSNLSGELALSPIQQEQVRPLLTLTSDRVFLERDRALLQMHLRLLEVHNLLLRETFLGDVQKKRLSVSRAKLKASILSRFAGILKTDEGSLPDL